MVLENHLAQFDLAKRLTVQNSRGEWENEHLHFLIDPNC